MGNYYVYVYIDPRNLEEFYYGKGKGSRKHAHLSDNSDSDKARRIKAIVREGLTPTIKVIAKDLSEQEALLVEKTLLWRLGKKLTNVSSGYYANKFRPHDKMHLELSEFDYQSGVYYYNVGEGNTRNWDDYHRFGFISGGGDKPQWKRAMEGWQIGDVVVAYLKRNGFVGIGVITARAKPIRNVRIGGDSILSLDLKATEMARDSDSDELCEWVALVDWKASVSRSEAKWKPRSEANLFTTTHVRASLDGQPKTIEFIESEFGLSIRDLVV